MFLGLEVLNVLIESSTSNRHVRGAARRVDDCGTVVTFSSFVTVKDPGRIPPLTSQLTI